MIIADHPSNEAERLAALHEYDSVDAESEQAFDDLTALASATLSVSVAMLGLIDLDRQWFKSVKGTTVSEFPRDMSFCTHVVLSDTMVVVPDTLQDPRFADHPMVQGGPKIRFYVGVPIRNPSGHIIGTLCAIDTAPRTLTPAQGTALRALARQAEGQLNLRRVTRRVEASERLARSIIDALPAHIAIVDESGRIVLTNRAWDDFAQAFARPSEARDESVLMLCDGSAAPHGSPIADGVRAVLSGRRDAFSLEYPLEMPGGREQWFLARASLLAGAGPARVVLTHEDVTDRHAAIAQLRHDARHDSLTGLPNRHSFAERVDHCIALGQRGDYYFGVLFLDLDRFKIINDSLGHAAGDALLIAIAARIQSALRASDVITRAASGSVQNADAVARMGGDEFTILLEHLRNPVDAVRVAERLRLEIAKPVTHEGHELTTTASIGIVTSGSSGVPGVEAMRYDAAKDLLRDADAAMYQAKATGKDRCVVFDQVMHVDVMRRMHIEADLRKALERDELELHYQPILDLSSRQPRGFEALVRWRRPTGLVSPGDFIPVAEDTGLIAPVGNWVIRQACTQLAAWRAAGPAMAELYVTINVSGRQLGNASLVEHVARVLAETGLPPESVALEITETSMMDEPEAAQATMGQLKALGVRLSIDDFGTGYSSLACLQKFPIDLLKVDRSFVQHIADGRQGAIVRTIIDMAHHLQMIVVAEGVEDDQQAALLIAAGCDLVQGFLFARPLPARDVEQFVRDRPLRLAA